MTAGEDQQNDTGSADPSLPPLRSAALAAGLLENACAPGPGDPLRLEVVRTLARDLKEELEALTTLASAGMGAAWVEEVEGALRAADVANLAACAIPVLPKPRVPEAVASTHLAAGAAQALSAVVEVKTKEAHGDHAHNVLKDVRGAGWRARLATLQVDEFLGEEA